MGTLIRNGYFRIANGVVKVLVPVSSPPSALNTFTGSSTAFSIRRLSSTATYSMRVRRGADNATLDIGFQPDGTIDTGSLLTFVGSDTGYVNVWYNQMDPNNDARVPPGTTIQEPYIVTSGSLVTLNGKPAVYYNGLSGVFATSSALTDSNGLFSTFAVGQILDTSTRVMVRTVAFPTNNIAQNFRRQGTTMQAIGFNNAGSPTTDSNLTNPGTSQFIGYTERTSTGIEIYINNTTNGATSIATNAVASASLGGQLYVGFFGGNGPPTFPWVGRVQEVIHYPQSPVTNNYRVALTAEINSYYGTF